MADEKKISAAPAKAVTAVKKDDTKPGFFKRVGKWFREMKSELKKVIWPTGKQLTNNTLRRNDGGFRNSSLGLRLAGERAGQGAPYTGGLITWRKTRNGTLFIRTQVMKTQWPRP